MAIGKKRSQELSTKRFRWHDRVHSVSQAARDLGISPNILTRWCREAKEAGVKAFPDQGKPRDEEIANL